MKRVAVIHPDFAVRGGAERKALLLAQSLLSDYDIDIYTFRLCEQDTFFELIEGLDFNILPGRTRFGRLLALVKLALRLRKYDLVHAHNYPANISAALAKLLYSVPTVWFCNEPLLFLEDTRKRESTLILRALQAIDKCVAKSIDRIVANSRNTASQIERAYGIKPEIIYSGIDTRLYSPRSNKRKKHLICVGRVKKHKNLDFLLEIMPKILEQERDVVLNIVGDGDYLPELKKKASKLGKHVRFWGNVDERRKIELYRQSQVFVFPNPEEPLGVTPMEAQACGLPVVAWNSGGTKETVEHQRTGYLAESEEEFVRYVLKLLSNPAKCEEMGKHGIKRASRLFSLNQMVDETRKMYEELI